MKIGLIQIDGKMPNLALMKLSSWHKRQGDEVTLIDLSHLQFDRIYGSKIFVGGSGVNLKSELPSEIELVEPDWTLFKTEYRIGFTSRGCIRDCGFCIVKEKEGPIRETPFDWVNGVDKVVILDNNFLASPKWKEKLEYFIRHKTKVCFTQGLDIRLINRENADLLSQVKYYDSHFNRRRLYFAFDDPTLEDVVLMGIAILNDNCIPSKHLLFYMLCGYNTTFEQDMHRFEVLDKAGCLPFVMLYHKKDSRLNRFARWVNKRYYKVVPFHSFVQKDKEKTSDALC